MVLGEEHPNMFFFLMMMTMTMRMMMMMMMIMIGRYLVILLFFLCIVCFVKTVLGKRHTYI